MKSCKIMAKILDFPKFIHLCYVWFHENLWENTKELKVNKLFYLLLQTHLVYFNSSI